MSVIRVKETLEELSNSFEIGDPAKSDVAVAGVIGLLELIAESPPSDAEDVLAEIDRFVTNKDSNQVAIDALSLELPKVVIKFTSLSDRCKEIVRNIMEHLTGICSPREMIAVLCEALDNHITVSKAPVCYVLLLNELSKVFCRIQRRQMEQVKVSLPVILKVICEVSLDGDEGDKNSLDDLFGAAYSIGNTIKKICEELEGSRKKELCAILGLYALQNIALVSRNRLSRAVSSWVPHVVRFSRFLRFCGLSYFGLITGSDVDTICGDISKVDGDDFMDCFSLAMDGASLAVIWGLASDEVADAAGQHLDATLNIIRDEVNKRWLAVGMLKSILSSVKYAWEIESYSIELLLSIMDGSNPKESYDSSVDFSSLTPSIFAVLRGVERIVICAPDASLRKKAFGALKKVLSNLPCSERFDILKALITNSGSPSMMAILIDLVKEGVLEENRNKNMPREGEIANGQNNSKTSPFWSPQVFDVVELILKPPKGGPPSLPEHCEPVLSALNLYRFILILESSGGTNQTGVLSENMLRRAYSQWLLPLRTLTMGIQSENERDDDELTGGILSALAPVQLVLHRCIELVEEKLKHSS